MRCNLCKESLPESAFYNGVKSRCRECHKTAVRGNRAEKIDYYRWYDRKRHRDDPCRANKNIENARRWYWKNQEAQIAKQKQWRQDNPVAYRARTAVGNALRDGRLEREPCYFCGTNDGVQAHHHDYSKPFDVTWLCAKCHGRHHALAGMESQAAS